MTGDQSDDHRHPRSNEPRETKVTTLQEAVDDVNADRDGLRALAETDSPLAEMAEAILERTE